MMMAAINHAKRIWLGLWIWTTWITIFCSPVRADDTRLITYSTDEGTIYLDDDRRPALYTGDFGDCQGDSLITLTRFDASLYRDNLTVMFHMQGSTDLQQEKVMMFFSVFAYGESRFNLTFNPCEIDIPTLCPLNASVPIQANGLIPIGPTDLAGIPSIAFSIPDFEGQAILRLFSNSTQSQIACYSAAMKNGNSFSHPAAVGSVLGAFTAIAVISSVAVTIYGQLVPETRTHYAHSISVFVVFSVLQHIFFTGSLSTNWPSVLVAFWSNYAWSAGMIYSRQMQTSIGRFIGSDKGNISTVGSVPTNVNNAELAGGYDISQLYRRDADTSNLGSLQHGNNFFARRDVVNSSTGFSWYGNPVFAGLPLPGNYSGFAGTLAQVNIPASNAFLTGLIWLLVLIGIVAVSLVIAKCVIELLSRMKVIKSNNLDFFKAHWMQFTVAAVMRTCFIAFFMMVYLALFQFILGGGKAVFALSGVVLAIFVVGMVGTVSYAIWCKSRRCRSTLHMQNNNGKITSHKHRFMNWYGVAREHSEKVQPTPQRVLGTIPVTSPHLTYEEAMLHVHDDERYLTKFGWLCSRYRRSKWWFFSAWLFYEVVRAGFYGGAAGHSLVQIFGLLAWEIVAFIAIIMIRPFESNRLNLLMVYLLGFSKVATVALSCAFDPRFGLSRILTTVIGIIIIVIQGTLTICLLIAIVLGTISTYMSLTRNNEEFKPQAWTNLRLRYFAHIQQKATDKPRPPPIAAASEPELSKSPYFEVSTVRREPKIEDDDPINRAVEIGDDEESPERDHHENQVYLPHNKSISRVNSTKSRTSNSNLPYGARAHRRSWSVRELNNQSTEHIPSGLHSRMSVESVRDVPMRYRAASMKSLSGENIPNTKDLPSPTRVHRRTRSSSHNLTRSRRSTTVENNEARPGFTRRVTEANETDFVNSSLEERP